MTMFSTYSVGNMYQSLLIIIYGPDPKRLKAVANASSVNRDGTTAVSTTGYIWGSNENGYIVTTPLYALEPFLASNGASGPSVSEGMYGVHVTKEASVFLPGVGLRCYLNANEAHCAQYLGYIEIPGIMNTLNRLVRLQSIAHWHLGREEDSKGLKPTVGAKLAVLWVPRKATNNELWEMCADMQWINPNNVISARELNPGQEIYGVGHPFGAHIGMKFNNFFIRGVISAILDDILDFHKSKFERTITRDGVNESSLNITEDPRKFPSKHKKQGIVVLADMRCPPGMEGAPIMTIKEYSKTESRHMGTDTTEQSLGTNHLVGFLLSPYRCGTLAADFTIIVSAENILGLLMEKLQIWKLIQSSPVPKFGMNIESNTLQHLYSKFSSIRSLHCGCDTFDAIVAVEVGDRSWASGVLVTPSGYVLTNAHAFGKFSSINSNTNSVLRHSKVRIGVQHRSNFSITQEGHTLPQKMLYTEKKAALSDNRVFMWYTAHIVHFFMHPIDLAVLKVQDCDVSNLTPSVERYGYQMPDLEFPYVSFRYGSGPTVGSRIYACGYPLWKPGSNPDTVNYPVLTCGNISKIIVDDHGDPAALLSTAKVYSGASGGALLDAETGDILGIITSNTRLKRLNITKSSILNPGKEVNGTFTADDYNYYPNVNYALPSTILSPVIDILSKSNKPHNFAHLSQELKRIELFFQKQGGPNSIWLQLQDLQKDSLLCNKSESVRATPPKLDQFLRSLEENGYKIFSKL